MTPGIVHDLVLEPPRRGLFGSVPVPADDDIASLALLLAAMGEEKSEVRRLSGGEHTLAMIDALGALGVAIDTSVRGTAVVSGVGLHGFRRPALALDCAGSPRAMRLLASVLVARPFETVLRGDAALLGTSMVAVTDALRRRGAVIEGAFSSTEKGLVTPPLVAGPLGDRRRLSGVEYELPFPIEDVKEALLLSGLYADEATFVRERIVSRDHAERLLQALDVPLDMAGPIVRLDVESWGAKLPAFAEEVPGDFSAAGFLLAAATVVPGSRVCVRGTNLNRTRIGLVDFLRHMGGAPELEVHRTVLGEPEGVACASHAPLRGIMMAGETLARASTDLPILVALAARARGETEVSAAGSLGAREGEVALRRLTTILGAFGVSSEPRDGGLVVRGRDEGPLAAADVDSEGDPGAAAAATILALLADAPSRIRRIDELARRFPRFVGTLRGLGVQARVERRSV